MAELTLLDISDVAIIYSKGKNGQSIPVDRRLDVFKILGIAAQATDFAVASGANINKDGNASYLLKTQTGRKGEVYIVKENDLLGAELMDDVHSGIRPKMRIPANVKKVGEIQGIPIVEYGSLPCTIIERERCEELNNLLQAGKMTQVKTSLRFEGDFITPPTILQYEGEKYFSAPAYRRSLVYGLQPCGYSLFSRYEPVRWLVDEKSGWMVSEKSIFSGFPYAETNDFNQSFKRSLMYQVLQRLGSEIERSVDGKLPKEKTPEMLQKLSVLDALSSVLGSCQNEKIISGDVSTIIQTRMERALSRNS